MPDVTVISVALPAESLPEEAGIPDLFGESIRDRWRAQQAGEILAVLVSRRTSKEWTALGDYLVRRLRAPARCVGISIDGVFPLRALHKWIRTLAQTQGAVSATLNWYTRPHPVRAGATATNLTWNAIYASDSLPWLDSIWTDIPSKWFHQGSDLMLTFYDRDVLTPIEWDVPLSLGRFLSALGGAYGWLIPLDDNIGFLVGVSKKSELRETLERPSARV